jgi:hypothetical protein
MAEDYNPWQTMSLNTIPQVGITYRKQLNVTNDVGDIEGARPAKLIRDVQKPDYHNPDDIRGTKPKELIPKSTNRPVFANNTADIAGAQAVHAKPSTRVVDPLNPVYQLPSYEVRPATPPKFYGDRNNDISDIAGTKPKGPKKASGRNFNDTSDIEGSSTQHAAKFTRKDAPRDFNDVSDIMSTGFKTTRTTNGLQPTYVVNGMVVTDDPSMRPKKLTRERQEGDFHDPRDIEGANSGYKSEKFHANRRQVRNPVDIGDIPGAGADTVVKVLKTKRVTDPNNPNYPSLCGSKLGTVDKPMTPDPRNSSFFSTLDKDGDGQVSYAELLDAADANHDGRLTVSELHRYAKGKITDKALAKLLRSMDTNDDGQITRDEAGKLASTLVVRQRGSSSSVGGGASGGGGGGGGARVRTRGGTGNQEQVDEVDRLRAELESLRREAQMLKATVPQQQQQQQRQAPASAPGRAHSSSAAAARAVLERASTRGGTGSSLAPTRVATGASLASTRAGTGAQESLAAKRQRAATAREIEAVRNLP